MKTKYTHLLLLSVSYPTLSFLLSLSFYPPLSPSLTSWPMGVVFVPGSCQKRQPISNQSGGQWLRQRSTLPLSEVLQWAVQRGLACIIKYERKPGPLNLPPNGDPSSITEAPLGGLYPKDPLSGSLLSPNCHWQIFFIGRKSCFAGPLALIHSSWLCSFKNSEGTPRVHRTSYLSSSGEK